MMRNLRPMLAALFVLAFTSINCSVAQPIIDRATSGSITDRLSAAFSEPTPTRRRPTPRPTFTPTPDYTATPTNTPTPTITPIPTDTPTPVPTDTPVPTNTPEPTATPEPTNTPKPRPPTDTPTPAPTPTPSYPFKVVEQGNRAIQTTNYHVITIYLAIVDSNNTPVGGLKIVGDHSSGTHVESAESDWNYSVANCLNCSYVKQGNLKFEPGPQVDGTWNLYLTDKNGTRLSDTIPLSYSSNPDQWVYDFLILKK